MATEKKVEAFLRELNIKIKIFGILFLDDRGKNQQTLLDLEISPTKRIEIIQTLKTKDYSDGPLQEKMRGILPMWIFGQNVKGKEIYIKISMGEENGRAICISFHIAEHPIKYQFK